MLRDQRARLSAPASSRAGLAPALTALAIVLQLLLARTVLSADASTAYFLGRPIPVLCGLRAHFGSPCPTCGMTRGMALTLHGQLAAAWHVHPGAPLLTGLWLGLAGGLVVAALQARRRGTVV